MNKGRLSEQIRFIVEIDKLKNILRQNVVIGTKRNENDAEHSWHLATMAMLLSEYAAEKVDVLQVIKMVLVHDLVEIDAGDTFAYDEKANEDKEEREQRAAERLFQVLPEDQADELMSLWREFEAMESPESRFAACLDRFQPLILNYNTQGHTWQKPGVTREKIYKRIEIARKNAPRLWEYASEMIEDAVRQGLIRV